MHVREQVAKPLAGLGSLVFFYPSTTCQQVWSYRYSSPSSNFPCREVSSLGSACPRIQRWRASCWAACRSTAQRCNVPHIGNLDALEQPIFVLGRRNLHVGHGCIGNRSHVPEWHSDASALAQVELHATHCGHQNCPITSLTGINPVSELQLSLAELSVRQ